MVVVSLGRHHCVRKDERVNLSHAVTPSMKNLLAFAMIFFRIMSYVEASSKGRKKNSITALSFFAALAATK